MSIVDQLKQSAIQYAESAATDRRRAAQKRKEADGLDKDAENSDKRASEYRQAAELMEPKTGGVTQEVSEMTAVSGASIGSCVGTSLHDDAAYQECYLREKALDFASRLSGLNKTEIMWTADAFYTYMASSKQQDPD